MFFRCTHNGACCEDPATQINITLGDIHRLIAFTRKSAYQLYREGVIGIWPFGDPDSNTTFSTDLGLFIPCMFRQRIDEDPVKKCVVYKARPLNCRLFPFWLIAELPEQALRGLIKEHPCLAHYAITEKYAEQKAWCKKYTDTLAAIMREEVSITNEFLAREQMTRKIETEPYTTKEEYRTIMARLVKELKQQDFSALFEKIDDELAKHVWTPYEKIPEIDIFCKP